MSQAKFCTTTLDAFQKETLPCNLRGHFLHQSIKKKTCKGTPAGLFTVDWCAHGQILLLSSGAVPSPSVPVRRQQGVMPTSIPDRYGGLQRRRPAKGSSPPVSRRRVMPRTDRPDGRWRRRPLDARSARAPRCTYDEPGAVANARAPACVSTYREASCCLECGYVVVVEIDFIRKDVNSRRENDDLLGRCMPTTI